MQPQQQTGAAPYEHPKRQRDCRLRRRALDRLSSSVRRRLADRGDSGQTIVIVIILLVLLATLAPVMASQIARDTPLLTATTNKHTALAAAKAGVQWYRDNLDTYSAYFNYSTTNLPTGGDAALTGYCGAGQSSTCDLSGTTPPEAFHYTPDLTQGCAVAVTGSACTVNLTVTGRAGTKGNYAHTSTLRRASPRTRCSTTPTSRTTR